MPVTFTIKINKYITTKNSSQMTGISISYCIAE